MSITNAEGMPGGLHLAAILWPSSQPIGNFAPYVFANVPVVTSRDGLWAQRDERLVMTGLDPSRRLVLTTSLHDAEPEALHEHPDDSIWPFIMALGVGAAFIAAVYTPWGLFPGTALALIAALGWAWPTMSGPEKVDTHR